MDAKVLVLLLLAAAVASGEVVNVTTSKSLEQYLCPPTRTVPPNTDVIISVPLLNLTKHDRQFCLIENTTNITISSSQELMNSITGYAEVVCTNDTGFGFFNITNLTVRSVYFQNCENVVPPMAVRYVNETDQFLYYDNVRSTLIFNHCCDLTLSRVSAITGLQLYNANFSIIGVNLCGASNVHLLSSDNINEAPVSVYHRMFVLLYYTDSGISQPFSSYELNVQYQSSMIDATNAHWFKYYNIKDYLSKDPERFPVSAVRGFGLYLTQQHFVVNAKVDIDNQRESKDAVYPTNFLVLFINSVTRSHVVLQSDFNGSCDELSELSDFPLLNPTGLDIVFYESPTVQTSSSPIISPITVRNVAFAGYQDIYGSNTVLNILKVSRKLSHQVLLENVSWCLVWSLMTLLHAEQNSVTGAETGHGVLHLNMVNSSIVGSSVSSQISTTSRINLLGIDNATLSGITYFAHGVGGSVINVVSSNLYITGDLTIANGFAYQGGGIRLDSASTLFLMEPLVARFHQNSAVEGNAIYVATNNARTESGVQILPYRVYSLDNVTDIDIHLIFANNTYGGNTHRSLYAPYFSFLGQQISLNLLFDSDTWDSNHSQYAYTTLIESIFQDIYYLDKYSSLNNGVCVQLPDEPQWNCTYTDHSDTFPTATFDGVVVYPGEKVISILDMDDDVYSVYSCGSDIALNHTLWNATPISTDHIRYLRFEFFYTGQCMDVILTNSMQSIPVIKVTTTSYCPVGFNLTETGRCDCIKLLRDHGYQCNINTRTFTNPLGYWTGFLNEYTEYIHDCRLGKCTVKKMCQ